MLWICWDFLSLTRRYSSITMFPCVASEPEGKRQLLLHVGPAEAGRWLVEARPLLNPDLAAEAVIALTEVAYCGFDEILLLVGAIYSTFEANSDSHFSWVQSSPTRRRRWSWRSRGGWTSPSLPAGAGERPPATLAAGPALSPPAASSPPPPPS